MSVLPSPLKSAAQVNPALPQLLGTCQITGLNELPCDSKMCTLPPLADAISFFPLPSKSPIQVYSGEPHWACPVHSARGLKPLPVETYTYTFPPFAVAISVLPSPLKSAAQVYASEPATGKSNGQV